MPAGELTIGVQGAGGRRWPRGGKYKHCSKADEEALRRASILSILALHILAPARRARGVAARAPVVARRVPLVCPFAPARAVVEVAKAVPVRDHAGASSSVP
jgi:hypothetical protein